MPARSAEFNHPMVAGDGCRRGSGGAAARRLAADRRAGRQGAVGDAQGRRQPDRHRQLRGRRPRGCDHSARRNRGAPTDPRSPVRWDPKIAGLVLADLLETARGDGVRCACTDTRSRHRAGAPRRAQPVLDADGPPGPDAEVAQPLYARYWLHNRGPCPLGGLPAVAHLHPETMTARTGAPVRCGCRWPATAATPPWRHGADALCARLVGGAPTNCRSELPARGHRRRTSRMRVPADAEPGDYPVRATPS